MKSNIRLIPKEDTNLSLFIFNKLRLLTFFLEFYSGESDKRWHPCQDLRNLINLGMVFSWPSVCQPVVCLCELSFWHFLFGVLGWTTSQLHIKVVIVGSRKEKWTKYSLKDDPIQFRHPNPVKTVYMKTRPDNILSYKSSNVTGNEQGRVIYLV